MSVPKFNTLLHQISHEFQAQLMTMQSRLYLLKFSLPLKKSSQKITGSMEQLENQIMTISHLFDDLISVILIGSEKQKMPATKVDLELFWQPFIKQFSQAKVHLQNQLAAEPQIILSTEILSWTINMLIRYIDLTRDKNKPIIITLTNQKKYLTIKYSFSKIYQQTKKSLEDFYVYALSTAFKTLNIKSDLKFNKTSSSITLKVKSITP
jgi:hypothetical protein